MSAALKEMKQARPVALKPKQAETTALANALGTRLRHYRQEASTSIRELARRIDVSPSLISQIEHGRVTPSVDTLFRIANELGLSVDSFFNDTEQPAAPAVAAKGKTGSPSFAPATSNQVVQRGPTRKKIQLSGGITWERLTPGSDDQVEFLFVTYQPGSESCSTDSLVRHGGKEYATVLSGRFGVTIGFEDYELGPGDSITFEAHNPHRVFSIGSEPATAIWVILNRSNDTRAQRAE
jgi:transcriptional regulator with XRE-family HTH domain